MAKTDAKEVKPRKRSKKIATTATKDAPQDGAAKKRTPVKGPSKTTKPSPAKAPIETIVIDGDESETNKEDAEAEAKPNLKIDTVEATTTGTPDFLSPVSKLQRSQEIAAKEQEARLEAAEAKRLADARQRGAKRKDMASDADAPTHTKVAKTGVLETDVETTTTTTMIQETTIKAATHAVTRSKILSEKKTKIVKNIDESATQYALRAANINKEERKKMAAAKAAIAVAEREVVQAETPDLPNASNDAPATPAVATSPDDVYETPEFVARSTEDHFRSVSSTTTTTFPDVMHVEEAVDTSNDAPSTALVRSLPGPKRSSTARVIAYAGVIAAAVGAVVLGATSAYVEQLPHCDANATAADLHCRPCPTHGVCHDGVLVDCDPSYIALRGECHEAMGLTRDSRLMATMLAEVWRSEATSVYCEVPLASRLEALDPLRVVQDLGLPSSVPLSTEALRQQLRADPAWKEIGPKTFGIAFSKALTRLGKKSDAAFVDLTIDDASPWCRATTFVLEYVTSVVLSVLLVALTVFVVVDNQNFTRDQALLARMMVVVEDELMTHAASRVDETEDAGYPIQYLRDHVVDILELSRDEKRRVLSSVWHQLCAAVRSDPRIVERTTPRSGVVWEWVGGAKAFDSSSFPPYDHTTPAASVRSA
ncbi:hypothetical protein SPRG_19883 [Saprolegnia parasitica CBS 223.65]|uniref:Man1/Src1 C-terminal domain-containing protein n=1 Tax=Saprolegnia parasitica (strain CBS 223.65) TaxID=695850 RepID=A0A067CJ77_SAPPC|nr:hypothetical protein SPRG_19883 [Saprolegnia parasitica CBS 223.65]KDO29210.1 hypothetical protein SPRG_19883 [Saprolegnia parasitica CBS 223.65]|eukprot:XP_012200110.1 hypothetical protein SPRG_19883 [Saprolegnia parasitica CBS 223.65]